jgi:hypothetical protein
MTIPSRCCDSDRIEAELTKFENGKKEPSKDRLIVLYEEVEAAREHVENIWDQHRSAWPRTDWHQDTKARINALYKKVI